MVPCFTSQSKGFFLIRQSWDVFSIGFRRQTFRQETKWASAFRNQDIRHPAGRKPKMKLTLGYRFLQIN